MIRFIKSNRAKFIGIICLVFFKTVQVKSQGVQSFIFPDFNNLSYLSSDDKSKSLYLYHENYFDTSGNLLKTLHFNSANSDLAIMKNNAEMSYTLSIKGVEANFVNAIRANGYKKMSYNGSGVWLKKPSEAWLKEESKFTLNGVDWKSMTSFKTVKIKNIFEYYSLEVKYYKGRKWQYTLVFGKDVGLLEYTDYLGNNLKSNVSHESSAVLMRAKYDNATSMRKAFIDKYFEIEKRGSDTIDILNEKASRHFLFYRSLDSLSAMAKGLCELDNQYNSLCKMLMVTLLANESRRLGGKQKRNKAINQYLANYSSWALYLIPNPNSQNSATAGKYIKNASSHLKSDYLKALNGANASSFNLINRKEYSIVDALRVIGFAKVFLDKGPSSIASINENVYNGLAYAYYYIGNYDLDFYYNALAAEQFLKMSEEEKRKNISYVESIMKDLMRKSTKNEVHYTRAIGIINTYKIPGKALLKAQQGYKKGFESSSFLFAYGDIALQDKSKVDVLKVIELLEPKEEALTKEDKSKLVGYYRFVGNNVEADKLEKELDKADKKTAKNKKRSKNGGGFPIGLSISTNPANLLWNSFPLAADLRIGGTIHQFRVNTHTNRTTDRIWGNYSLFDNNEALHKEWSITKGRDYNYSLLFNAGDNIVAGLQLGYGAFNLAQDIANISDLTTNSQSVYTLNPEVNRYSAAMQWGWRFASRKKHYYLGMYYIAGVGYRTMDYRYTGTSEIEDEEKFLFIENKQSNGYRHENWNKAYGIFNFRVRVGITLF